MSFNFKRKIREIFNNFGYEIDYNKDLLMDKEFSEIYNKCKDYTMTSKERMYSLYKATKYIVQSKIPGDFVECGVWKGGSAMVIAFTLLKYKETKRKIYLYDTFEGMSKPTEKDFKLINKKSALNEWKKNEKKSYNKWFFSPIEEVKKNMSLTGYPQDKLIFVAGKVEETLPKHAPKNTISLLRLDTDFYESTKHELIHLFPLLSKKGVLIIDDYGYWAGSKKAVDEYFSDKSILLNRIDNDGRIGLKI